jgi:hypothetical protein
MAKSANEARWRFELALKMPNGVRHSKHPACTLHLVRRERMTGATTSGSFLHTELRFSAPPGCFQQSTKDTPLMAMMAMTVSAGGLRYLIDGPWLIDDQPLIGAGRCASFLLPCGYLDRSADLSRSVAQARSVFPRQSWRCSCEAPSKGDIKGYIEREDIKVLI